MLTGLESMDHKSHPTPFFSRDTPSSFTSFMFQPMSSPPLKTLRPIGAHTAAARTQHLNISYATPQHLIRNSSTSHTQLLNISYATPRHAPVSFGGGAAGGVGFFETGFTLSGMTSFRMRASLSSTTWTRTCLCDSAPTPRHAKPLCTRLLQSHPKSEPRHPRPETLNLAH